MVKLKVPGSTLCSYLMNVALTAENLSHKPLEMFLQTLQYFWRFFYGAIVSNIFLRYPILRPQLDPENNTIYPL